MKAYPHVYMPERTEPPPERRAGNPLGLPGPGVAGRRRNSTDPGGLWSPETLLVAPIADCFILTFRGVLVPRVWDWLSLEAHVEGTLERVEGSRASLAISPVPYSRLTPPVDHGRARELLERAEKSGAWPPTRCTANACSKPR